MENQEFPGLSRHFWDRVHPLLPHRPGPRGAGRPPVDPQRVFAGVIHVLRTGCPWKGVNRMHGSGSTLHRYYRLWERSGVFHRLWESGLAEAAEMEGIAWRWQPAGGGARTWRPVVPRRTA